MGCDVHGWFEIKINGTWYAYSQLSFNRNYDLFAKMAGVRNYNGIDPIAPPRGLPADISVVTAIYAKMWKVDGHSWSWLNAREIKELYQFHVNFSNMPRWKLVEEWGYLFDHEWSSFIDNKCRFEPVEDIRMVFWFDN